jgi:hypothetical protein
MRPNWWIRSAVLGLCWATGCTNFNQLDGPQVNLDRAQYRLTPWWATNRPLFNTPASRKTAAFLNSLNPNFTFLGAPCPYGDDFPPGTVTPAGWETPVVEAAEASPSPPPTVGQPGVVLPPPADAAVAEPLPPNAPVPQTAPAPKPAPETEPMPEPAPAR